MARKSRPRKRKAKKKNASQAKPALQEAAPIVDAEAVTLEPDDVVLASSPKPVDESPTPAPIIRQADVIEIRPVSEPESEEDLVEADAELDWVDSGGTKASLPVPTEEEVPEDNESLEELESLQSELNAMLEEGEKAMEPVDVTQAEPEEESPTTGRKRILRFERKLQAADRLPTELDAVEVEDSSSDTLIASAPILAEAPKALPVTDSPWGGVKAGGGEAPAEHFYGGRNFLTVVGEIPVIGKVLISEGALRPLVVFILVFTPIVALTFVLVVMFMMDRDDPLRSVNKGVAPVALEKSVPLEEIEEAVRDFASASTWEEKLKYVRAAGHVVEPLRSYYEDHAVNPAEDVVIERAERVEMNGLDLFKVEATLLPQKEVVTLVLERDSRGYLKVDWAVAVDYQEADWQQFYDDQVSQPTTLRVALAEQRKPYHNFQFEDEEKFRGYRIWYPDSKLPPLNGYAEIGSDLDKALQSLVRAESRGHVPVILSVAYPEDAQDPSMVRMVELVSPSWVVDYEALARSQG